MFLSNSIQSHPLEWRFRVKNNSGDWVVRKIILYNYFSSTGTISQWKYGWSDDSEHCNCNFGCDINSDPDGKELCPDVAPWNPLSIPEDIVVVVVIEGNDNFGEDDYFCKLGIPANLESGLGYDFYLDYNSTSGDFSLSGNQRGVDLKEEGKFTNFNITLQNDFDEIDGGGYLKFKYDELDYSEENSPFNLTNFGSYNWPAAVKAEDQTVNNLFRDFQEWQNDQGQPLTSANIYSLPQTSATYKAYFNTPFDITVQNELPGYGNSGTITVNDNLRNSPYNFVVIRSQKFSASVSSQTIDNVQFTFIEWYKNGSPTQETSPFEPSGNDTYTAKYNAKPLGWSRQLTSPSSVGQLIELNWNDHPSSLVSYKIYRKVGSSGTPVFLANVAHGVEEWTESDYVRTGSTSDPLLQYDVRPYYSLTTTSGDAYFENIAYGFIEQNIQQEDHSYQIATAKEAVEDYFVGSYPNPFNPQSTIRYNIPKAGYVILKVYNSIGKEVAELVNASQEAGSHSVIFDGTDLASGIYLYSIQVNDFAQSEKMLLLK